MSNNSPFRIVNVLIVFVEAQITKLLSQSKTHAEGGMIQWKVASPKFNVHTHIVAHGRSPH